MNTRLRNRNNKQVRFSFLSRPKSDGVVDAVHYTPEGKIDWVRAYERRGPTWSDNVLLDREMLIARLKAGKRFHVGQRVEFEASEFEIGEEIRLHKGETGEAIVLGDALSDQDDLGDMAVI
jgi:hypothetical protein